MHFKGLVRRATGFDSNRSLNHTTVLLHDARRLPLVRFELGDASFTNPQAYH